MAADITLNCHKEQSAKLLYVTERASRRSAFPILPSIHHVAVLQGMVVDSGPGSSGACTQRCLCADLQCVMPVFLWLGDFILFCFKMQILMHDWVICR